jgi:hypothetical protein
MMADFEKMRSLRKDELLKVFKAFRNDRNEHTMLSALNKAIKRYRISEKKPDATFSLERPMGKKTSEKKISSAQAAHENSKEEEAPI